MSGYKGVLVYCEVIDGKLAGNAPELIGAGASLAGILVEEVNAVLIGSGLDVAAKETISYGAGKVFVADDPNLKDYSNEAYLAVLGKVVEQTSPQIVLMGQTVIGRDLAPRLAFRLETGATLDCIKVAIDSTSKRMIQTKPVYGGKALAEFVCDTNPQLATLRTKTATPAEKDETRSGKIIKLDASIDPSTIKLKTIGKRVEAGAGIKLEDAKVIICGGRGMEGTEGFMQLQELADLIPGAVVGASRPPCDAGWIADNKQIGLTGKIVGPDLYFAVAVSGSSQHLSGCSNSKSIVAINKDPGANIFKVARFGVVGDWNKILPSLIEKVRRMS